MTTKCKVVFASLLVLIVCSGAPSDDKLPSKQSDQSADRLPDKNAETATKVLASMAKALNACDPKSIAELFTPKGEFIDADGNVFDSHEAIAGEFTALFEVNPKKTSVEIAVEEIREISPGILSVDCVATFSDTEGADEDKEKDDVDFSALLVRQSNGSWLFASIRSDGEGNVRTPHARLKRLEWLIGEWIDESDDSTMHSTTRWSEDSNFLVTDFTIRVVGRKVMSGTQRIGWDGSLDKFKSWVFDSEGGHAEGIWTEIDDRWVVKVTGVRPDGDVCSATNTYEQAKPDTYLFSVTDRIIGDETAPDFTSRVVRRPPEPQKATAAARTSRDK